ncbi:hypothetical protein DACRYDRAFT_107404 [Dacryopinax primogenitus]|uniref:Uncharacterized protein n=1 Tax=Dacryopinax primogenitus (strain DJM 731) TaxID=1858805 RepID=M5G9F0_DACPD|nr:uncharacterized protein DACRYDRAFT_107404 [Dacryopinax primogenitus]EJU02487.1 hypothetical protein DACRYDRAFT_107404 [Dacryopinax primogenitus]
MLHIFVPGPWVPVDLDIVLPETASKSFEAFLLNEGYLVDQQQCRTLARTYPQSPFTPASFRYQCFSKGKKKIDLCYIIVGFTPISHILTYHSTAVMNCYDGYAFYCLFPDMTFAHEFVRNNRYKGEAIKRELGVAKLEARGFKGKPGDIDCWFPDINAPPGEGPSRIEQLPSVWAQALDL